MMSEVQMDARAVALMAALFRIGDQLDCAMFNNTVAVNQGIEPATPGPMEDYIRQARVWLSAAYTQRT